jgi:hypothetical protein
LCPLIGIEDAGLAEPGERPLPLDRRQPRLPSIASWSR